MNHNVRGHGGPPAGPPWSVDVLADLHAGAIEPHVAQTLWPQVNADPEARAILAALDATTAELHEFANAPAPPMPAHFAARLDAAIAAESQARKQQFGPPPQQAAPQPPQQQGLAPVVSL